MKKPKSKKEAILQAATVFFSEKGFRDTSMAQIAKISGVADGTIFYHFKTKEDLFLAVLDNFKNGLLQECQEYLAKSEFDNGLDMVEGIISFYLYLAQENEEPFLLLHRHFPYKVAEKNSVCKKLLEDIYSCFVDIFEQAIVRGQQDGSIGELSAQETALIIFAMVDGLVRIGSYNLYKTGILFSELKESCRRMLKN